MLRIKPRFVYDKDGNEGGGFGAATDLSEDIENYAPEDEKKETETKDEEITTVEEEKAEVVEPSEIEVLKQKQDRMQSAYKTMEYERNKFKATLNKFTKAVTEHKLAEVDDDYNLVISKGQSSDQEKELNPIQQIDSEINDLTKKFKDADIEDTEYYQKLAKLESRKGILEYKAEQDNLQQQAIKENQKKAELERIAKINADCGKALDNNYKDHSDENSVLFKKMAELNAENPLLYGKPNDNMRDRLLLAKEAALVLNSGKKETEIINKTTVDKHKTLDSGNYDPDKHKAKASLSDSDERLLVHSGLSSNLIEKVKKDDDLLNGVDSVIKNGSDGFFL